MLGAIKASMIATIVNKLRNIEYLLLVSGSEGSPVVLQPQLCIHIIRQTVGKVSARLQELEVQCPDFGDFSCSPVALQSPVSYFRRCVAASARVAETGSRGLEPGSVSCYQELAHVSYETHCQQNLA